MNCLRFAMSFHLQFVLVFVMVIALPLSGCDQGPRRTFAPQDTPLDKEQFSHAKLAFKDEVVQDGHVILEKGKEYDYSGSFQLAQVDDEAAEFEKFVTQVQSSLGVLLVIDKKKSGYDSASQEKGHIKQAQVVDTYAGKVPNTRFESPNIIHFSGRLKAPNTIGEQELRIFFVPENVADAVFILTRLVQVVEPNPAKAE